MQLLEAVKQALLLNELSGNQSAAYRFSNASNQSGLSFGLTQLDVTHNSAAVACLKECGFTDSQITRLKNKSAGWKMLSTQLAQHKEIVDRYDAAQVKECLDHVMLVAKSRHFEFANDEALVHLADYHNQYYLSTAGDKAKMANALAALGRPVRPADILAVKLDTAWGKTMEGREDLLRRYNNIARLMGGQTL